MHIVIIGNGVAGATCALAARQRDAAASITLISGETDYFFSRTALMYAFMDRMTRRNLEPFERGVWDAQRIERVRGWVVDHVAATRTIALEDGRSLQYDRLVLALGTVPMVFNWEGLDAAKDGVAHFVSMQHLEDCERLAKTARRAVVVGGGLIGIELVECLVHHGIPTTFLIREPWYWPVALGSHEAKMVVSHMQRHGVDVRLEDEMTRVHTDAAGRVTGIDTREKGKLPCDLLGICTGVRPAIDRIKAWTDAPALDRGVVVDGQFRTSLPDVFAIGDCATIHRPDRPVLHELIWYSAKRHGQLVGAHTIWGDAIEYTPPLFFNSSRFFEIDYTTVGDVMRVPAGTQSILLTHPKRDISLRIVHDGDRVLGFNMLGARFNHELLQRWILERRHPAWVLDQLPSAQFDPEFGRVPLHKLQRQDLTDNTLAPPGATSTQARA